MSGLRPQKGKIYYAKRHPASSVVTVEVLQVTGKTVLVRGDVGRAARELPTRYKLSDIEFVEEAHQEADRENTNNL